MPQPAPDIPNLPNASPQLVDFLTRFRTWAVNEINQTVQQNTATPQILLLASDQKPPLVVHALTVDSGGTIAATQVPLGSGKP